MTSSGRSDDESDAPAGRVQSDLPGQDAADTSAAGAEQDGLSLDTVHAAGTPGEEGLNSSGDSVGDDETLPDADRVTGADRDTSAERDTSARDGTGV